MVVCFLHNLLGVQQHETAFLREFSEEFAFIWSITLKGVLFGRNNILGVLTVCSLAQVDRRVRQLKLVRHKCLCSWGLLSSSVHFGMYLPLINGPLCWPGGKQHWPGFCPDIYLPVNGSSVRAKFEGVFPSIMLCPCVPARGNISVMSISPGLHTSQSLSSIAMSICLVA